MIKEFIFVFLFFFKKKKDMIDNDKTWMKENGDN